MATWTMMTLEEILTECKVSLIDVTFCHNTNYAFVEMLSRFLSTRNCPEHKLYNTCSFGCGVS